MLKKLIFPAIAIVITLLIGTQHSVAASYYIKPFLTAFIGICFFVAFLHLLIKTQWREIYLLTIFAFISINSFNLCYMYTKRAQDFKNQKSIMLSNIWGKGCPMDRSAKSIEFHGKDKDGNDHILYTNHKTFDNLRGTHFNIKYLPTSKIIVEITTHTPEKQ